MISKEKIIQALKDLLTMPGDYIIRVKVEEKLRPLFKKDPGPSNDFGQTHLKDDPANGLSAIGLLDEVIKKYKQKSREDKT